MSVKKIFTLFVSAKMLICLLACGLIIGLAGCSDVEVKSSSTTEEISSTTEEEGTRIEAVSYDTIGIYFTGFTDTSAQFEIVNKTSDDMTFVVSSLTVGDDIFMDIEDDNVFSIKANDSDTINVEVGSFDTDATALTAIMTYYLGDEMGVEENFTIEL